MISPSGFLFKENYLGVPEGLVADKEESLLDIFDHVLIKVREPFLRIKEKINPIVYIEVVKQTALTIACRDEEATAPKKSASPRNG